MTTLYPYRYHPQDGAFSGAWHADYAADTPTFLVASCAPATGFSPVQSGWSDNGGLSWTPFATIPLNSTSAVTTFGCGSIHVGAPDHIVWVGSYSRGAYRTTDRGATWTALTIPGVTVTSLNTQPHYIYRRPVASEKTAGSADTFYCYANGVGFYRSTDAGATWTQRCDNTPFATANWNQGAYLKAVPGHAGHLFFTPGYQGTYANPVKTLPFLRSVDGGTTWTQVPSVLSVRGFDFGMNAPGQSYPAIYAVGVMAGVTGVYHSDDNAATWTLLATQPNNTVDFIRNVGASQETYGLHWITTGGSGLIRGALT